jgi:hypothetical protein
VCPDCSHSLSKHFTFFLPPWEIKLLCVPASHVLLIRSSGGGLGGCFPSLDLVNSAVLITCVWMCLLHVGLGSFECVPRGGIPASSGASLFCLKRSLGPASPDDLGGWSCHQVCARVPAGRNPGQHLWLSGWVCCDLSAFVFFPWNG